MADQPLPADSEVQAFLGQLQQYRASLKKADQQLLDGLVAAGLGHTQDEDPEEEVNSYWVAYHNPDGTTAATLDDAAGWRATPWGAAYGVVRYRPST